MSDELRDLRERLADFELRFARLEKALGLTPWTPDELRKAAQDDFFGPQEEAWRDKWRNSRAPAGSSRNAPQPRGIRR